MNHERVNNRILASFATGVRGDLDIADFQRLDGKSAHLLIEYNSKLGRPRGNDIEAFFQKTFEGKVVPLMASCSIKANSVSIVAQLYQPVRPMEDSSDKAKMTPVIAGLMYLDNQLQDYWQVQQDEEGKKILSKAVEENIEQIIASRRNRMFITQASNISLASVGQAKELLGKGAVLKVFDRGQMKRFTVSEKVSAGFKGKFEGEDKEVVVAKEKAIDVDGFDLQEQGLEKLSNEDAMLQKYFFEAYGDKNYASKLVKAK